MPARLSFLLFPMLLAPALWADLRASVPGSLLEGFAPELRTAGVVLKSSASADGGLLLFGEFDTVNGEPRPGVAKLQADGTLDPNFRSAVGLGFDPRIETLFSLANGRTLVGAPQQIVLGASLTPTYTHFFLQPDGSQVTSPFLDSLPPGQSITPLIEYENRILARTTSKTGSSLVVIDSTTLQKLDFPQATQWPSVPLDLVPVSDGFWVLGGEDRRAALSLFKIDRDGSLSKEFGTTSLPLQHAHYLLPGSDDGFLLASSAASPGPIVISGTRFVPVSRQLQIHTHNSLGNRTATLDALVGSQSRALVRRDADGSTLLSNPDGSSLVRYRPDGELDPNFSPVPLDGQTRINYYSFSNPPDALALPPLPAGLINVGTAQRYLPDGSPDPFWQAPTLQQPGTVTELMMTSEDRFFVAGNFQSIDGNPANGLARFYHSGEFDPTFSIAHDLPAPQLHGVFPNGEPLVSLHRSPPDLRRLRPDGSIDFQFQLQLDENFPLREARVDDTGRIYVLITREAIFNYDIVKRYLPNGTEDASFAHQSRPPLEDGRVWLGFGSASGPIAPLPGGTYLANSVSHGEDGRYGEVLPGQFGSHLLNGWVLLNKRLNFASSVPRPLLSRWHPDHGLDSDFQAPFLSLGAPTERGSALSLVQGTSDGRLLTAGIIATKRGDYHVLRLHQNGTPDFAFAAPRPSRTIPNVSGLETILAGGNLHPATRASLRQSAFVHQALELPNGTIILGGSFSQLGSERRAGLAALCPGIASTFSQWCKATFARVELPVHLLGPHDDPDNDGTPNFYEFAVGSDPLTPDFDDNQPRFVSATRWTVPRNPDAAGMTMVVELSRDLLQWTDAAEQEVTIETNATSYTINLHSGEDSVFLRVRFLIP